MVHVQTAHMMNIYQLADSTKLQNVSTVIISVFNINDSAWFPDENPNANGPIRTPFKVINNSAQP